MFNKSWGIALLNLVTHLLKNIQTLKDTRNNPISIPKLIHRPINPSKILNHQGHQE